jgi:multidrug efflux pump subunit AcrA (membrane-fusion protein)
MSEKLDLKQLAVDRGDRADAPAAMRASRPKSRWISRIALPIAVLVGFLILVGAAAGHRLLPVRGVTVTPVVVKRSAAQPEGQPLFQAPGWIEPRPTPINVPALAAGIVEELAVVEGQTVQEGMQIAKLISIDAELAVRRARTTLQLREAEYRRALAEQTAAETRMRKPLHLQVVIADAESELAAAELQLAQLPHSIVAAEADLEFARENVQAKRAAGEGVSAIAKQQAEAELKNAEAKLSELRNSEPNLRSRVSALERKVAGLREQLDLLIEETRQLEEARANVATAAAMREEARIRLEEAELRLARMQITAPRDGRVLRLIASPGDRVMGMDTTAEHRSSTIVQMYDPSHLQVRVDVRLEDVPMVTPGQRVKVETAAAGKPIDGYVLLPTSTANIQKNTLEVKVALRDPPESVTPEMLVTSTFLAPPAETEVPTTQSSQRIFVPRQLVETDSGAAHVWVVDPNGRAETVRVKTGTESNDGLIEVLSGLDPTHKLISDPNGELSPGERVRIDGEDRRFGWSDQ